MTRPPGEYLILTCLGGSLVLCGYEASAGSLHLEGHLAAALVLVGAAIGALAFVLIIMQRTLGAILCVIFYGLQLFSVTLPSRSQWGLNFQPTIYIRLYGDKSAPTTLNFVAALLFGLSLALLASYRERKAAVAAPPNTSLERTRDR